MAVRLLGSVVITVGLASGHGFGVNALAASDDMQPIGTFLIDRTEATIADYARFVDATGSVSDAEKTGGGFVYDAGWERMPGWTWREPFGTSTDENLPAVHLTFDEAAAYCRWNNKRLPTDSEWALAAYTEQRAQPTLPFETGKTYLYPTGDSPRGANCLEACGPTSAIDFSSVLSRGVGPAPAATDKAGVNGLFGMGANVWEWTRIGEGAQQGTRGGSWWYGAAQMGREHRATKARDMAAVYIGFRCVRDL